MARSPRADEAGGLYHVLNRANFGAKMFRKEGNSVAFEKVFHEALRLDKIPNGVDRVNEPLTDHELKSMRDYAQRGALLGMKPGSKRLLVDWRLSQRYDHRGGQECDHYRKIIKA